MDTDDVVRCLIEFPEPAIRYRILTGFLGEDPGAATIHALRAEIRDSPLVAARPQFLARGNFRHARAVELHDLVGRAHRLKRGNTSSVMRTRGARA